MVNIATYIGVQQPDGKPSFGIVTEGPSNIIGDLSPRVAEAIDHCSLWRTGVERYRLHRLSELPGERWALELRQPAVEWVMIAMTDEGGNACIVELSKALIETELRLKASVCAIVNIASNKECVDLFVHAQLDNIPIGLEGCLLKHLADVWGDGAESTEGTIEVKVCGMDEAKTWHPFLSL